MIVNSSCRHIFEANGGGGKDYRTALICISAGGQVLPPFILYSGKYLMDSWCKGGPPGTQYGVTPKVSANKSTNFVLNKSLPRVGSIHQCMNIG